MSVASRGQRAETVGWFKPYPAYKDSGVEWLGKVPIHWETKRLKLVAELNPLASEVQELAEDTEVSFVPMEAVGEYGGIDLSRTKLLADVNAGYTYFRDGDVIVAKITPCFENGKGALAGSLTSGVAFGTTELHVFRAVGLLNSRFLFYVTLGDAFRRIGEANMYGAGGQKRVSESFFRNLKHPVPTPQEQEAIADFLDRETARIDGLVAKKERLIELLQEKRTALITRAVTKGLDPNVPMKDSGVEWLGEIPARWETLALGRVINRLEQGWSPVAEDREAGADEWAVIKLSAVHRGRFVPHEHKTLPSDLLPDSRYEIQEGDLLLTRANTPELVGDVCVVERAPARLMLCDLVYRITLDTARAHPVYVAYWLLSGAGRYPIEVEARGSSQSMVKVSQGVIRAWPVVLPPNIEQRAISAYLDRETARNDTLVAKIREAIDRLKEFRTGLISAAVTGKIDVREEVA